MPAYAASRYGSVQVLRGVKLAVAAGEIRLLIGRNGSGKSTTLKAIAGLIPIDAGTVRLDDRDIADLSTRRRLAEGVAFVPQAGNGDSARHRLYNARLRARSSVG